MPLSPTAIAADHLMTLSPFQARFIDDGAQSGPVAWQGLHGSSLALALHSAASRNKHLTLVVMRSSRQAQMLEADLRLLAIRELPVLLFPDHETLPYDPFSPHPDIISQRLATLAAMAALNEGLLLTSVSALANRLPPADYILQRSFDLKPGQTLVMDDFRNQLLHAGYDTAEQVYQPGQFAIRGSVIDLFPAGHPTPVRIDLFDQEIDTIRAFDPESQLSTGKLQDVRLLPAREYPTDTDALDEFRRAFRLRFDVDTRQVSFYQDLRSGVHPQGLEQYLPLFYPQTSSLLDYIRQPVQLVMHHDAKAEAAALYQRTTERWEQRRYDIERPVLDPDELFFTPDELHDRLDEFPLTLVTSPISTDSDKSEPSLQPVSGKMTTVSFSTTLPPDVHIHERGKEAAADLTGFISDFTGQVLFAADSPGRREVLATTLAAFGVRPTIHETFAGFHRSGAHLGLVVLPVERGFSIPDQLALLTETQIFGGRTRQKQRIDRSERDPESIIRNLSDLSAGKPVVHEDRGVGRYLVLEML